MKRNACSFAVPALIMASFTLASAADAPYCPPGATYCPAPGANNTAFMDTHFGIDAATGVMSAYPGPTNHLPPNDRIATTESVILVAPTVSVENRYVPPELAFGPAAGQPAGYRSTINPVAMNGNVAAPGRPAYHEPASEVANQTSRRSTREPLENNDKLPWWKGGMWRNRKDGDNGQDRDRSEANRPAANRPSASTPPRRMADDDSMWDDDDYSGYNPDGTFGRQGNAGGPFGTPPGQAFDSYAGGNPYGGPTPGQPGMGAGYADPYAASYGAPQQQGGTATFAGEPYTDPNYNAPYGAAGYGDPYGQPAGQPYGQPAAADPFAQPAYAPPYGAAPAYGSPAPDPWGSPTGGDLWAAPDPVPQYQGTPSIDAAGSPQFENAVRMVKENRFSEAKNLLVSETSRNPGNPAAWRWLADCHYNLLELDDAITCYGRAMERDANDYYALRGQGFAYLHRGHEYWRRMQEELNRGQRDSAAATFAAAHEDYKKSLELLGLCLRRAPNDGEAVYGEAMAAEGASRKLYSNAISFIKLGPEHRGQAELFAENCLTVINKGIERSRERSRLNPGDAGPRALLGGLYLRKAILYRQLEKNDLALMELRNSRDVQQSILDEIDRNNAIAQKNIREAEAYWEEWGGNRQ